MMIAGKVSVARSAGEGSYTVTLTLLDVCWCEDAGDRFPRVSAHAHVPGDVRRAVEPHVERDGRDLLCTFELVSMSVIEVFTTDERGGFHDVYCLYEQQLAVIQQEGLQMVNDGGIPLDTLVNSLI